MLQAVCGGRGMKTSKDGATVGLTLRLDAQVHQAYKRIASRLNMDELEKGGKGGLTAQDVMRDVLASSPEVGKLIKEQEAANGN